MNENSAGRVTLTTASGMRSTNGRTAASASRSAVAGSVAGAGFPIAGTLACGTASASFAAPSLGASASVRVFCVVRATRRRVVCSPRSPDSLLSRSLPIVVMSPRRCGIPASSSCSTGSIVSAVATSGVPTGRLSSTVNSP